MSNAVKPDFFQNLPTVIEQERAKALGVTEEERHYHALASHQGWIQYRQFITDLLRDLDDVTEIAMTQGLSLEEIGRNALVANMAKGIIKRSLQRVDDAVEAVERPDGTVKE